MSQPRNFWVKPEHLDIPGVQGENPAREHQTADLITFLCGSLSVLWKDWPKHMELTTLNTENGTFTLRGACPHCHEKSVFILVTNSHVVQLADYTQKLAAGMQCQGCLDYILGIVVRAREYNTPWAMVYVDHYPIGTPDDSVDENVPTDIAADFAEALRCQWIGSYKAAVAMCRRSVEAACKDLKATGKDLYLKIEDLAAKDIITEPMRRMAHRVRLTANRKLHDKPKQADPPSPNAIQPEPGSDSVEADDLDLMKEKDAKAMIRFTTEFFHHVYALTALLEEYDQADGEVPPALSD